MSYKLFHLDIETIPNNSYHFQDYNQNISPVFQNAEGFPITFAVKQYGKKKVITDSIANYHDMKDFKKQWLVDGKDDFDIELITHLHQIIGDADVICGHNVDKFDLKKIYARMLKYGMPPPKQPKVIDTYKIAKKYFNLRSNRLQHLLEVLDIGSKVEHEGGAMWVKFIEGDKKAIRSMLKYNKGDVALFDDILDALLPWAGSEIPDPRLFKVKSEDSTKLPAELRVCPRCSATGTAINSWGMYPAKQLTYNRYRCMKCSGWLRGDKAQDGKLVMKQDTKLITVR